MSTMTPGVRKALIAVGIAVVLSGGGVATVWAAGQIVPSYLGASPTATATPGATPSATPSPDSTVPAKSFPGNGRRFHGPVHGFAGLGIHGEFTVKNRDGTYTTIVTQVGTVQSVSASQSVSESTITVKSDDGFTQSYAIASSTSIARIPGSGTGLQGRKPSLETITASDLKAGDTVRVSGTKSGTAVTATRIIAGTWPTGLDKAMPNNTAPNNTPPGDHGRRHRGGNA
jgi:hypothetical protein